MVEQVSHTCRHIPGRDNVATEGRQSRYQHLDQEQHQFGFGFGLKHIEIMHDGYCRLRSYSCHTGRYPGNS
jgi:hypothetical protein